MAEISSASIDAITTDGCDLSCFTLFGGRGVEEPAVLFRFRDLTVDPFLLVVDSLAVGSLTIRPFPFASFLLYISSLDR